MKLSTAAKARFGNDETNKVMKGQPFFPDENDLASAKWDIDGDTAKRHDTNHEKFVGPGLRRINGVWKYDLTLPPEVTEDQIRQQVAMMNPIAETLDRIAQETAAGKYKDVYDLRDALADALKAAQSNPPATGASIQN